MTDITYVVPYYRAPAMLAMHLAQWACYDQRVLDRMRLLVVDDGSPEPAEPIVRAALAKSPDMPISLFRIKEDIPWNRNGARNLGSHVAKTPWILHTDIDHLLIASEAQKLVRCDIQLSSWYRFKRFRVGAADETRNKDALPRDATYGEVKPHGDSYLCTRVHYWRAGGYDEDYSGHLGGGTPFLDQMTRIAQPIVIPVALHVYTRHAIPDASVSTLSRDTSHYSKVRTLKTRNPRAGVNPLRFTWEQAL